MRVLTIFVELRVALAMTIDVFPGLGVDKGELIGHGAKDGAIFEMQLVDIKGPASAEETVNTVKLERPLLVCDCIWQGRHLLAKCGR